MTVTRGSQIAAEADLVVVPSAVVRQASAASLRALSLGDPLADDGGAAPLSRVALAVSVSCGGLRKGGPF